VVLVTHDRFLLDRVCTRVLGFDGSGNTEYFADYEQWLAALSAQSGKDQPKAPEVSRKKEVARSRSGKLSYMDQREYDQMEELILAAEVRLGEVEALMASPGIMTNPTELQKYWQEQQELQDKIDRLYDRWNELDARKEG